MFGVYKNKGLFFKKNSLSITGVTISVLFFLLVVACSAGVKSADYAVKAAAQSESYRDEGYALEKKRSDASNDQEENDQKLIVTYDYTMETTAFDETIKKLESFVAQKKGYIENYRISNNDYYRESDVSTKRAFYVLRIPKNAVFDVLKGLNDIGYVLSESKNTENVTRYYKDLESQIRTLKNQEDRLNELYKKAQDIKDIIEIETKLADVIERRAMLTSDIEGVKNKVEYVQVSISLREVSKIIGVERLGSSFLQRMGIAFKRSLIAFKTFFEGCLLLVITIWPFILIVFLVALVIIKKYRKKKQDNPEKFFKKKSKEKKKENNDEN